MELDPFSFDRHQQAPQTFSISRLPRTEEKIKGNFPTLNHYEAREVLENPDKNQMFNISFFSVLQNQDPKRLTKQKYYRLISKGMALQRPKFSQTKMRWRIDNENKVSKNMNLEFSQFTSY